MGEASPPSEGNGPMLTEAMKVYNVIKKAVKDDGWMDTDTLKLAIKEMRKEDPCGENSKNSNPSCCKHYFNPLYVIKSLDGKYQSLETAMSDIILEEQEINDSRCHNSERQVLCIPVIHGEETENAKCAGQHWTLYAFHLNSRKVSILDSRRSETSDTRRHQSPWHLICDILDKYDWFKVKSSDKPWEVDILKSAPEQPNSNDCGFYVFKFMRRWDGDKLDKSWKPPESIELRKEFLEYMLTPDALKDISSIDLAELYEYTIDYSGSKEEVWISSTYPTQISLDVKSIQNLLNISGCMDTKSLNLAIRKMVIMKSNDGNSADSKPLSFKHYISADFARYAISKEDEHTNMETCILHDFMDHHSASNPQVLCIPVMHEGHWTLYAFNMDDEKVSILDPSLNMDDEKVSILDHKRHKSIRLKICKALECAKAKSYLFRRKSGNFSCWKYEFVKVTRNKKSCDSGFIIFNYMLWWDGGKLDESKMPSVTDSINLRKKFLEYILCFKDNLAYQQPHGLSKLIETLSSARTRRRCLMDNELLNVLIEGKAVPEEMDKELLFRGITTDGEGVLHISARIGDMKVVRAIFDKFQVGNLLPISNSTTKNHKVCSKKEANNDKEKALKIVIDGVGKEKIIEFADFLMTRNYRGETCLHEAIRWDRKELVTSLILVDQQVCKDDMPSLVKRVDYGGISPLYLATMLGRTDIVLSLTKKDDGYKVLAPSSAGPGGRSALHAAILTKNKKLIKQLVEWNPDLKSEQDKCGSNPLHIMASVKGLDVTELLPGSHADHQHSKGPCDFLKKDSEGMLPIHVAASNGRLEIIKRLLKACRHCMCSRNASGQSFLHVAVEKKWVGVVRHVCKEQTLDGILNLQDHDGNTALHLAVKRGYQLIFCFLMSNPGVCLNLPNKEGHTPRDLATLGIDPHLKLLQNSRVLISLHLRLAGAKFATCRKDEQYMAAKHIDKENPSDKLTKFAGPMAVCAIFMLNISVAAFFSIAKSYLPSMDPNAPPAPAPMAVSNSKRAFKALIISDTIAFSSAALAAFCSTFAALSVMDRPTRLLYIRTGGTALQIASMAVVAVFVLAVYLAFGPIDSILPTIAGVLGLVALSPQCTPLFFIILHAWTLIYRSMLFDSIHKYIVLKTQTTLKQLPSFVANSSVSICGIVCQLLGPVLDILCMCLMMLGKLICCIPLLIGFAVVGAIAALICFLSPW